MGVSLTGWRWRDPPFSGTKKAAFLSQECSFSPFFARGLGTGTGCALPSLDASPSRSLITRGFENDLDASRGGIGRTRVRPVEGSTPSPSIRVSAAPSGDVPLFEPSAFRDNGFDRRAST
jgi:hypothetical protein